MNNRNRNILFNTIFWLLYFLYEWLGNGVLDDEYNRYFINACMVIPTAFVTAYLSVHYLPRFFYSQKHVFWIGQIAVAIAIVLIRRTFNYYYTYPLYYPIATEVQPLLFLPKLIIEFVNLYVFVSLYAMFYFVRTWSEQQRALQELQQQKTNAELELLKMQVHPHFIFNTLNNIYSVTIKKSPDTANYLLKLASFLDYNLYNARQDKVPMAEEVEYIRNYLTLQQLRYGNRVDVALNVHNTVEGLTIAPLLLLPLIENSFKHGADTSLDKAWIRVDISRKENEITIKIENSKEGTGKNNGKSQGLGIANVQKRMELIYGNKHDFRLLNEKNTFMVILKIKQ
ncbi:MAG: histidine kinase [Cyclobacteriaceae bacterium]|nr:histidine kinase [Cyclobacteriaceae bacterium]